MRARDFGRNQQVFHSPTDLGVFFPGFQSSAEDSIPDTDQQDRGLWEQDWSSLAYWILSSIFLMGK